MLWIEKTSSRRLTRKMGLQYGVSTVQEFLWTTEGQLANLEELGEKHGLRYDPNSKTFTLDGDRWDEMIKLREFGIKHYSSKLSRIAPQMRVHRLQ